VFFSSCGKILRGRQGRKHTQNVLRKRGKKIDCIPVFFLSFRYFLYLSVVLTVLKNFVVTHTHTHIYSNNQGLRSQSKHPQ